MRSLRGLPELAVELDGVALAAEVMDALDSVRVQQRLGLPALCELTFAAPPSALARAGVPPGARLRVVAAGASVPLFEGEVTAAEFAYGPSRELKLRVRGYDLLHRLRKRQPVRAHVQVTLADLARELTADLGVSVEAAAAGPLWPYLVQGRQSDLDLLNDLASRCGVHLTLRGSVLHLLTLEGEGTPLPLLLGESLLEAAVEVNADPACRSVSAAGWDVHAVEPHQGRASRARVGREVHAEAPPARVGGTGERTLVDEPTPGSEHAEALAQAELDRRVAREVVLRGVAEGDARLRPGARVRLAGVAPAIAGTYVLTSVTHTVDAERGFVSELSTEPPPERPRSSAASAALAVVSQVDGRTGRARATLPTFGGVETDWMQVASLGAGPAKGLAILPDVGDQVLVLFTHDDPAQGVVLAGLHGAGGPKDPGIEGGAVRRFSLLTAGGHAIKLDDVKKSIRVEDSSGSFLELSPDSVHLRSAVSLVIEAPGQSVVIRGDTVDFRRG